MRRSSATRLAARRKRGGCGHKRAVLSVVERGDSVRSVHIDKVSVKEIGRIVANNVRRESTLMTDEGRHYTTIGKLFSGHETVEHTRGGYVRDDARTNTLEGFYSVFERGMKGCLPALW
jgi:hypothetical protein